MIVFWKWCGHGPYSIFFEKNKKYVNLNLCTQKKKELSAGGTKLRNITCS